MEISALLSPERTLSGIDGLSQKRTLEILANTIAEGIEGLDADEVFRRLIARERLGSTGIGFGVAIPHSKIEHCHQIVAALATLKAPIDFDSIDGQPVDIIFAIIVPEDAHSDHLATLAALANRLTSPTYRQSLRNAASDQSLFVAATASQL